MITTGRSSPASQTTCRTSGRQKAQDEVTTHEEHLLARPTPDGLVEIKSTDGGLHTMRFTVEDLWTQEPFGIVFKTQTTRKVFPWSNILWYEVKLNSEWFNEDMLKWLKDCDHEWLTHPRVGNYCQHCRLDMSDMGRLYEDKLSEPPPLVITDKTIDKEAGEFEGTSLEDMAGQPHQHAGPHIRIVALGEDPTTFCACDDSAGALDHPPPCRLLPGTWPTIDIDPDGTQF